MTLLFAAMLGANRLFVADHEEGGFDGFLLAPVDRTALLVAKASRCFGFLALVEIVAVPAFVVLLLGPGLSAGEVGQLALVLVLADVGIAVDRHARRRAGDPDPRPRPDRAADRAARCWCR